MVVPTFLPYYGHDSTWLEILRVTNLKLHLYTYPFPSLARLYKCPLSLPPMHKLLLSHSSTFLQSLHLISSLLCPHTSVGTALLWWTARIFLRHPTWTHLDRPLGSLWALSFSWSSSSPSVASSLAATIGIGCVPSVNLSLIPNPKCLPHPPNLSTPRYPLPLIIFLIILIRVFDMIRFWCMLIIKLLSFESIIKLIWQ